MQKRCRRDGDLTGQTFNRLTVLQLSSKQNPKNSTPSGRYWNCLCVCGKEKTVCQNNLVHGQVKSCGCLTKETTTARSTKHGHRNTGTYRSYCSMLTRCHNSSLPSYKAYGGRGIAVCERWQGDNGFQHFLEDMGERPQGFTLDRIDVNGHYTPENCRWASRKLQNRNKRSNHVLTHGGESRCVMEWSDLTGIHWQTIISRLRLGWSVEQALTQPVKTCRKSLSKGG